MPNDHMTLIERLLAATSGSGVAVLFLPGDWVRKLILLVAGSISSYWLAPPIAVYLDAPESAAGFLVGLLSMALVDVMFRTLYRLELDRIVASWLTRRN